MNDRVTELYNGEIFTAETQRICRDRIHWMCGQIRGERVLDIGCSQGIGSILAARDGRTVVGVDVDEEAIAYARRALESEPEAVRRRVTFLCADIHEADLEGATFDTVILGEVIEHLADPRKMMERATRFLAPDGVLVVATPFGFHPHDDHKFTFYLSSFVETIEGLSRPTHLEIADGYIRFAGRHLSTADVPPLDLGPPALLARSETAFLAKERAAHDVASDRKRRLQRATNELKRAEKRAEALEAQLAVDRKRSQERAAAEAKRSEKRIGAMEAQQRQASARLQHTRVRIAELAASGDKLRAELKEQKRLTRVASRLPPILPSPVDAGPVQRGLAMMFGSLQHEVHSGRALRQPHQTVLKTLYRVQRAFREAAPLPIEAPAEPRTSAAPSPAPTPGPAATASEFRPFKAMRSPGESALTVATILDTFSESCFRYEANLVPLSLAGWQEEMEAHQPAFLFAESAWRGNNGQWQYLMSNYAKREQNPLRDLLAWCRARSITTVFWNKEDPANFDVFKDAAADFDVVFTTDENCIARYRELLGHDRIFALPFAAQPAIHNPMQDTVSRTRNVCFAGSWRADKYPERVADTQVLLAPAFEHGLHIYDRFAGTKDAEKFAFPPPYRDAVRGSLDYDSMLTAYRGYKTFLNVNSVKESPTMFSRRVFELLACGTPVVSSESVGIRAMLGSLVKVATTAAETQSHLEHLLGDEDYRGRFAHAGYREVLDRHTYSHRFRAILDAAGIPAPAPEAPLVTVLAATNRPDRLENLLGTVRRQVHPSIELIILLNSSGFDAAAVEAAAADLPSVKIFDLPESFTLAECLNHGVEHSTGTWIAKIDDDDYYGPHYLSDLLLATSYTDAAVLGKRSYFCYLEGSETLALRFPDLRDRHVEFVHGGTLLIRRDVLDEIQFTPVTRGTDTIFLRECRERGIRIYSADPYNFIHVRHPSLDTHTWQITDEEILAKCRVIGPGLDMGQVMI